MGTVVEDDAVLQNLTDGSTLVLVGGLQDFHGARGVSGYGAGEEVAAGTKAQLGRTEGVFYRAVRTRLRHEATR